MQINLSGHHVAITPALRHYVNEKLPKLSRFFDPIPQIHVVLKVEKIQHTAEATIQANGEELHATSTQTDMYAAIDGLVDKLVRRLTKYKNKSRRYH